MEITYCAGCGAKSNANAFSRDRLCKDCTEDRRSEAPPVNGPITLSCEDCGSNFIWNSNDQIYFRLHHYEKPKRCLACRAKKRREKREEREQRIQRHAQKLRENHRPTFADVIAEHLSGGSRT
jgi:hypothetical protein